MRLTVPSLRGAFLIKAMLALIVVALGDFLFWQRGQWAGAQGLFGLALASALVAARPAVIADRRALSAAALAAIFALAMIWDPSLLAWVLFWVAIGLATLLPATALFGDGWQWFQRLLVHAIKALFGPLIDFARLGRVRLRRGPSRVGLRSGMRTLVLPLLGSAVILALFAAANPLIDGWLASLSLPRIDEQTFGRLLLGAVLFVMAWGVLRPRLLRRTLGTFDGRGDLAIPGVNTASVLLSLIAFNALFALQNAMDLAYLSGWAQLPSGITLAQYAHRGAYPLVATALLAALFVLVALRPGSATATMPLARRLVALWIGQNLLLVASAAWRTWDYVEAYSLTELRIAALAWMALVAVGLVLVLWRIVKEHSASWLINANLAAAGGLLAAICFVDLGGVAASWNARHAREIDGTGAGLDLCYLAGLEDSALPALVELEQRRLPGDLGRKIGAIRWQVQTSLEGRIENGGWSLLAERRLAAARLVPPSNPSPERDCHVQHD
ncbi:MAG TPA: DUF4173 domain-containing protein [Novosphingobium sp.]|nr:DUF4173 domain-containing protein [Novosphingobium sp.]